MTKDEREKLDAYLRGIVSALPSSPGCYQYLDDEGKIIYVGKAKNLKNRVSSYFTNPQQTYKTSLLVPKIRDIRYVVVRTEEDALLLENSLIKRYKPRYNVLLKDDKTYPSIAITKEYLPRIFSTRNRTIRGAQYFGPYSHVPTMHALLALCRELYCPRPCRKPMTEDGVASGKYELCLEYHIHNCLAPCVGKQSHDDYMQRIEACREILKGNTAELSRQLKQRMLELSEQLRFEEAQEVKAKFLNPLKPSENKYGQEALDSMRKHPDLYRQLASRYILIGHSMGGVVSREYVQGNFYNGDVDKIITLDSPH